MSFFPETNTQLKCLDLGHSSSIIHWSLFSLPELKLKELRMRRQDKTLILAHTAIKVEHVVFSTQTCTSYKPSRFSGSLGEVFHLKPVDLLITANECAPCTVLSLQWFTVCPSSTNKRELGRGLDELVLDLIKFDDINIREFFMSMRHLSNQHGTTCVDAARLEHPVCL